MLSKKTFFVGLLLFVILASGVVYVSLGEGVKMRVDDDKTTFYTKNVNNRWVVSGREYNKLYSGSSLSYRDKSTVGVYTLFDEALEESTITRVTGFQNGAVIKDTYTFDGTLVDVELFPVEHKVEVFNGSGLIYQYEVRDLVYDGITIKNPESPLIFGRNMKVEWSDGAYWSTVYNSGIVKVRYRVDSDYEVYHLRLFDPPPIIGENVSVVVNNASGNSTHLNYNVTWSDINWSAIVNISGNYSWNHTWYDLNLSNASDWTFNITANGTNDINVSLHYNVSNNFFNWTCNNTVINTSPQFILNLSAGNSSLINCTLDLLNVSQTYVDWVLTENNASWNEINSYNFSVVTT